MFTFTDQQKNQKSLLSQSEYPPEVEHGSVEYKLKLVNTSKERLEQLSTQLKWRLAEGSGQAMYEIGVSDKGILVGLNEEEMDASMKSLKIMGDAVNADMFLVRKKSVGDGLAVAEVLFRKCMGDDQHFLEIRVAVLGKKTYLIKVQTMLENLRLSGFCVMVRSITETDGPGLISSGTDMRLNQGELLPLLVKLLVLLQMEQ
jgi:hypothetical protein